MEAIAVVAGLIYFAHLSKGTTIVWFIDNSSALGAILKGRSDDPLLHSLVQLIHLLVFVLDARIWWEWVESEANWSDGASREFGTCLWAKRHEFALREVPQPDMFGLELQQTLPQLMRIDGIGQTAAEAVLDLIAALGDPGGLDRRV